MVLHRQDSSLYAIYVSNVILSKLRISAMLVVMVSG